MMFTRTVTAEIPERERMDTEALCPPHDFDFGWAAKPDAPEADTVPALYCRACGDIRAFRLPE